MQYLKDIGFCAGRDRVYPDLAFSLPTTVIPYKESAKSGRSVVGLGVMEYAGKYSVANPNDAVPLAYLDQLVEFAKWLLARKYDIRLLIGDVADLPTKQRFRVLLRDRLKGPDGERVVDERIGSVEDLLSQIVATDIVVATRFHNVLLALLCNKPVISISFHHKCESLMRTMGLLDYCLDINDLTSDRLIEKFRDVETNMEEIKSLINRKARELRESLDEQYKLIFTEM